MKRTFATYFIVMAIAVWVVLWIAMLFIRPAPSTSSLSVMWGDDYMKKYPPNTSSEKITFYRTHFVYLSMNNGPAYEFGLREDGVVVWREAKP